MSKKDNSRKDKGKKVLHLIAQAHLDPVWLWPRRDGCSEALTTMQSAIERMKETPELCFCRSSAITYQWVREMDPRLFVEIRRRVKEGRWEVVNGWIVQPDCNIPSTESFVRHCLYGKNWFSRQLGVDVKIGYNVDSFGHGAGLPQILAKSGYKYYVFMRPHAHECHLPVLFWWEGPDGSRVLAWRIPTNYGQSYNVTPRQTEDALRDAAQSCFAPGFNDGVFFFGVGNHGGGPTKKQLKKIIELQGQDDNTLPELRFSTLARFFSALEKSPAFKDIPVVKHELQHHAPGCYSAMSEIKALNRRTERSLIEAESLAALTWLDHKKGYPKENLEEAWWGLLFNQFHDILAGTSVKPCYDDARDSLGAACAVSRDITVRSIHSLARRVDTTGAPGTVLFLMNPLPWKRRALVQFDTLVNPQGDNPITHLETKDGRKIPLQWVAAESSFGPHLLEWKKLTAVVELPACGYRTFRLTYVRKPKVKTKWKSFVSVSRSNLGISSLRAVDGTELLSKPIRPVVIRDTSDTWGHGTYEFRKVVGTSELTSTQVIEDGPVIKVIRQKGKWRKSEIIFDIITYRDIDVVELRIKINWQERHQILKIEVPTKLSEVRTFAKVAGAVIERHPGGKEEPGQDWVALQGRWGQKTYALGLVNDSTYSYDCLKGLLRATLVRSAPFAQHDPVKLPPDTDNPYLDQGWQEKKFWLVRGRGNYTTLNLPRRSEELQTPAEYVIDSAHPGKEPWEKSFLSVAPESITVTAVKRSEDGKGIIVRLQEMKGRQAQARIQIPGMELDWKTLIGPFEIKTVKITVQGKTRVIESDLLENSLVLGK